MNIVLEQFADVFKMLYWIEFLMMQKTKKDIIKELREMRKIPGKPGACVGKRTWSGSAAR